MITTLLAFVGLVSASPVQLDYTARLLDAGGTPLNGTQTVIISLRDAADGLHFSETFASVPVQDGYFAVTLGESGDLDHALLDGERVVVVSVGGQELSRRDLSDSPSAAWAEASRSVQTATAPPSPCTSADHEGRTYYDKTNHTFFGCYGTAGWKPVQQGGVTTAADVDLYWGALHIAAAAACRGSTTSGGTGCCANTVRVRDTASGATCSTICAAASQTCDAEVSIWGRPGKATSNGEAVGNFYNYTCSGSGNGGSEATTSQNAVLTTGYWSFCCCRT